MKIDEERTARSYLLAQLPPAAEERFEEQLLEDAALRALTEVVEADLHDQFVRGELSPKEREAFFARFGHRVERVDFAHALTARARRRRRFGRRWLLPLAAALVIAAGLAALRSARTIPGPRTPPQTASVTPAVRPKVPAPVPAPVPVPASRPQTSVALTIALTAAREGSAAPRLDLPPDAGAITLRVRIPAGDQYPRYEIDWTVGGATVWTGPARRDPCVGESARVAVLVATIPAARLEARRYEIIVVGIGQDGAREILGTRAVLVHR